MAGAERNNRVVVSGKMTEKRLLGTGLLGTFVAGVCCATPILVIALGGLGLSAALAWLDFVVIPAFVFFVGLTIYAVLRLRWGGSARPCEPSGR